MVGGLCTYWPPCLGFTKGPSHSRYIPAKKNPMAHMGLVERALKGFKPRQLCSGHQLPFVAVVMMVLETGFVLAHLAVELVDQFVHGGVQIFVGAFREQIAALDMDVAFGPLSLFLFFLFFHRQQDLDVHNLIEVPGDAVQLLRHVGAQGGGDFQMMATDCQVH
jgi:hypothetical protein